MISAVHKEDKTNIQASLVAVLPPALKSNRTHHAERRLLKSKKCAEAFDQIYYITKI